MAVCIARVAATGADLTSTSARDKIAAALEAWGANGARDIGTQTSAVLRGAGLLTGSPSQRLLYASTAVHQRKKRSAGNGALMRTGIVELTRLPDRDQTAASARALAELTHYDWLAGDSAVLWSEAARGGRRGRATGSAVPRAGAARCTVGRGCGFSCAR
jgi:ADP-ribosyl-[dinitrogen reductase] hydrolase